MAPSLLVFALSSVAGISGMKLHVDIARAEHKSKFGLVNLRGQNSSGLLDGQRATTHWASLEKLRERYPEIKVVEQIRFVDEGHVITSAEISAGIDMSLHIVARLLGKETAEETARGMEYRWTLEDEKAVSSFS